MSWKNWPKKLPLRDWQIRFSVNLFPNMLIFSQRIFFLLLQPKPLVHLIALFHFIFKNCCRKYSVYIIWRVSDVSLACHWCVNSLQYTTVNTEEHRKTKTTGKQQHSSVSVKCVGASILLETQHNETKMMAVSRHVMVTVSVPTSAFCPVRSSGVDGSCTSAYSQDEPSQEAAAKA